MIYSVITLCELGLRRLWHDVLRCAKIVTSAKIIVTSANKPYNIKGGAKMSTIRDVAALANVSIATVSRVLNNDTTYKMTQQTKDRVWKAVAELNYKAPAASVRKRVQSASSTVYRKIGCIMNLRSKKYTDPYYLSILSGAETYLTGHNCEVSFVKTRQELENNEALRRMLSEPVDGIILMHALREKTFQYILNHFPYVVGVDTGFDSIDNVEYDHFRVAQMAVECLAERGYKEIGFIGGSEGSQDVQNSRRFQGFLSTMNRLKLPVNPDWIIDSRWDDNFCMKQVENLYHTKGLPRAFFVASDLMAMATLRSLYNLGVSVPSQVAVMGLTSIEMSKYSNPPLSTIEIPTEEMGATAAKILLERMDGDTSLPKRIILPSRYVIRDSI